MTRDFDDYDALDALVWQIELGADEAISEEPINRFEAIEEKPVTASPPQTAQETNEAPIPAETGPSDAGASELAAACDSLQDLRNAIEAFEGCPLKKGAKNTVFSDGLAEARVMIIGDLPDRDEDTAGKPFVGRPGQLLDKMLAAIGLSRISEDPAQAVYITNVMPWRPPQNRDPSTDELSMMKAFLKRHIALASPDFILTMGNPATKTLLDVTTGITRMRGQWGIYQDIPVLPMFHPSALLRDPLKKREAWADLLSLKAKMT